MQEKKLQIKEKLARLEREAEERDAQRRAIKANLSYVNLITAPINIEALALISKETAEKAKVAAVEIKKQKVALAVFDPNSLQLKEVVKNLELKGYQPSIFVVSLSGLKHAWNFYKFVVGKAEQITGKVKIEEKRLVQLESTITSLESIKGLLQVLNVEGVYDAGQVLEIILAGALANKASDVHLEPEETHVKLRLRIDGVLHDIFAEIKKNSYFYLSSRIKLLSGLKLNIHNEPQDGRFTIALPNKEIEIRTSIIPSEFGETIVLRMLDPETIMLTLQEIGFRNDDLEIIKKELEKPNGMILNTGPTGSGKTTTLYTFLRHTQKPEIKIITIEDPIEYHLKGIEQTQVNPESGYTFDKGLRSILRQDPDMILVGEIRDIETAEIAMHAALTGHLVFSTLHTNEASGAIPRLVDMGVKPSIIASAINIIIAQRLVRRICEKCRFPQEISSELKNKIKKFLDKLSSRLDKNQFQDIKIFQPKGCQECNYIGYHGRIGIFELMQVDEEIEKMIAKESIEAEIKNYVLKKGMITMQQDGIIKTLLGVTTFEEVERNTGPIEW